MKKMVLWFKKGRILACLCGQESLVEGEDRRLWEGGQVGGCSAGGG